MARKKKTYTDKEYVSEEYTEIKNVSDKELPKAYNILSDEDELMRQKVKSLRDKGFDNNRIAAMLMINKEKVEKLK